MHGSWGARNGIMVRPKSAQVDACCSTWFPREKMGRKPIDEAKNGSSCQRVIQKQIEIVNYNVSPFQDEISVLFVWGMISRLVLNQQ